jgi:hypothetical protein
MGSHVWSDSFTSLARSAADGVVLRRGLAHSSRRTQCCCRYHRRREYLADSSRVTRAIPAAEASTNGRQSKLSTHARRCHAANLCTATGPVQASTQRTGGRRDLCKTPAKSAKYCERGQKVRSLGLIPFRFVDGIIKAWQRYSTHR